MSLVLGLTMCRAVSLDAEGSEHRVDWGLSLPL